MRYSHTICLSIFALIGLFAVPAAAEAVERHGPPGTEQFEVHIDTVGTDDWQSVTIPGKSVEQDTYREGAEDKHKKKPDKKHEREERTTQTDGRGTVVTGQIEQGVVELAGDGSDTDRYNEIANVQDMDSSTEVIEYIQSKVGEIIKVNTPPGLIDELWDDNEVTIELKEGRKGLNAFDVRRTDLREAEGGKTVGAGKITVIIERAGNGGVGITIRDNESGEEYYVKGKLRGYNSQTEKEIKIPAKKTVKFKPGAELSNEVK